MPRHPRTTKTLLILVLVASLAWIWPPSASASTSDQQSFRGLLRTSGVSGQREVVFSHITATGVFNGVGTIVEVPNLPGDPDNVSRDDLVFPSGSFHLVSVTNDATLTLDPRTCRVRADLSQTSTITGGTGSFASASGSFFASVHAQGFLPREPDGSCSQALPPLRELDRVAATGTLSL